MTPPALFTRFRTNSVWTESSVAFVLQATAFLVWVFVVSTPAFAQDTLPDGPGKDETVRVCSQCHEAQKAASVKLSRQGWTETIDKMKVLGAQGAEQEFQAILEYLSTYFKGDLDQALDLNTAEALDLESVLQLLRRESAAFVQFRSKRGPFTSMADLKDLDPAILKKIDARKERVVFLTKK
jgi:DNA uptake protein ComE-like DNA-binding protein